MKKVHDSDENRIFFRVNKTTYITPKKSIDFGFFPLTFTLSPFYTDSRDVVKHIHIYICTYVHSYKGIGPPFENGKNLMD